MSTTAPPHPHSRPTPWRTTYAQLLRSAGPLAPALRRSLLALALAGLCQGFALACLYPIFDAAFAGAGEPLGFWLLVMTGLALLAAILRWYEGRPGFIRNPRKSLLTDGFNLEIFGVNYFNWWRQPGLWLNSGGSNNVPHTTLNN